MGADAEPGPVGADVGGIGGFVDEHRHRHGVEAVGAGDHEVPEAVAAQQVEAGGEVVDPVDGRPVHQAHTVK